jgi:hypothetical protein
MASAYKGVVISPSLTKTAGGQDMYIPFTGGSGPTPTSVSQIVAGAGVSVSPTGGTGVVTVVNSGVTQLVAGTNVTLTPAGGTGAVTVSSSVTPLVPAGAVNSIQAAGPNGTLIAEPGVFLNSNGTISSFGLIADGPITYPWSTTDFPRFGGLAGSFNFQVTLPGNGGQLTLTNVMTILADRPHILAVNVVSTTSPNDQSCLGMVSCGGGADTPVLFGAASSSVSAYNLSVFGSANPTGGQLQVVGGVNAAGGAGTVYVTILA